jgi:hypothetical protein
MQLYPILAKESNFVLFSLKVQVLSALFEPVWMTCNCHSRA